ncbi:MAG: hypothetical protein DRI61_12390 [Chloroflexi bacterium]|nr:MAG: hypothetical protein DRI61_12390 [Chloroflexota bacterium]
MIVKVDKSEETKPGYYNGSVVWGYGGLILLIAGSILSVYVFIDDLFDTSLLELTAVGILTFGICFLTALTFYGLFYVPYVERKNEELLIEQFLTDILDEETFEKNWEFRTSTEAIIDGTNYHRFKFMKKSIIPWHVPLLIFIRMENWNKIRTEVIPKLLGKPYKEIFQNIISGKDFPYFDMKSPRYNILELDNKVIIKIDNEEISLTKEEYEDLRIIPRIWNIVSKDEFYREVFLFEEACYVLRKTAVKLDGDRMWKDEKSVERGFKRRFEGRELERIELIRDPEQKVKMLVFYDKNGGRMRMGEDDILFYPTLRKLKKEGFKIIEKTKKLPCNSPREY